ncbi:MAG: cadherin domain-containing protein [Pirellulaceae bacterium]|nr:cadherin domain-containing protein [Pirellulaceae bacterium]
MNSTTAGNQVTSASSRGSHQAVAISADGSYVIVWSDDTSDGNGWGVYAKRFNADGTTRGTEFRVNSTNAGNEQWAVVASDGSGRFAIAWTAVDANGTGVYLRRFNADGSAIDASDVLVNWQATSNDQQNPSITMNNAGEIVIAWETRNGGSSGIYAKRFDMTSPASSNQVPTPIITVDTGSNRYNPVVDINENGQFVIVWNNDTHVFAQRYAAGGSARGAAIDFNILSTALEHQAVVAVQDSGDFIIAYRSQMIGFDGIWVNHYRDAGTAYSLATKVSTGSTHTAPSLSMDAIGNFIVVYEGDGDGSGQGVFGRKYDASAVTQGAQFQISQSTNGNQQQVSVAMTSLANFVAVWSGNGDRSGQSDASGVFARQFASANATSMISDINDTNNAANEGDVNGTTVGIWAQAVDLDPGDTISYSLTDNAGGRFAIHATSGVVTVANSTLLDYETATSHGITVRAASSDGSFSTKLFSIAITPVNDNNPVITSHGGASLVSLTIAENTTSVTSISATDADNPSQTLSFGLVGGVDQSRFSVNATTGQLSFLVSPNFESPSDRSNDNVYEVVVAVSDGQGGSASQSFTVTITDINEFQVGSISDLNSAVNEVIENVPNGTLVGINAFAKDNDGLNNTVTYSLLDNAGGRFSINATSGVVRVADGTLLDREVAEGYDIVVRASSSDGSISTQSFRIGLIGANDNLPVFTSADQVSIVENQSFVQVLTATDDDKPTQSIAYSIVGGPDSSHFVVRSSNQLTFVRPPNFENPTDNNHNNIYRVAVAANDQNGGTTVQLIQVQVTNANESPTVVNQKYFARQGHVVQSAGLGVLTGAFDEDGDPLTASLQRDVSNGVLVLSSNGTFNYTPNDGFAGLDSFTFAVSDGNGGVSVGLVEFVVNLNTTVLSQGANIPSASDRTKIDSSQSTSTSASSTSNNKTAEDPGTTPAPQTQPTITVTQNNDSSPSTTSKDKPTSENLLAQKDSENNDKSFSDHFARVASTASERESHSMQRMIRGLHIQSNDSATAQQNIETLVVTDIMVAQDLVWADLDRLREQMQVATESQPLVLGTAAGVASSLSVGYVMWLVRGGYVVAGLMAQLPAWRLIDPLPILSQLEAMGDDDDDDSLQTMVDRSNDLHDKNTLNVSDEQANQDTPSFVQTEMSKSLQS